MKTQQTKPTRWLLLISTALILLAVQACQPKPAQSQGIETAPTAASPETAKTTAPSTNGKTAVSGSFQLTDPKVGLDGLTGYHQHFEITTEGTANGQPVSSDQKLDRWVNGADESRLIDGVDGSEVMHLRTVRLASYDYSQQKENGVCRTAPVTADSQPFLDPRLPPVTQAAEVETAALDGIQAAHYRFDQSGVYNYAGKNGKAQGEFWLAVDGGYLLKYDLTLTLDGQDFTGKRTWSYTLDSMNQGNLVSVPPGCLAVLSDFPALPDAENVQRGPAFVRYTTGSSVLEAAKFYQDQLPAQGWNALPGVEPTQDTAVLDFSHANPDSSGQLAVISVRVAEGQTQVVVQVAKTRQVIVSSIGQAAELTPETEPTEEEEPESDLVLPDDLPVYPGAQVLLKDPQNLILTTRDSADTVLAYYQSELENAGWTAGDLIDTGVTKSILWNRDGFLLRLVVMQTGEMTQIVLTPNVE